MTDLIHRCPVDSRHKGPIKLLQKAFACHDVIMKMQGIKCPAVCSRFAQSMTGKGNGCVYWLWCWFTYFDWQLLVQPGAFIKDVAQSNHELLTITKWGKWSWLSFKQSRMLSEIHTTREAIVHNYQEKYARKFSQNFFAKTKKNWKPCIFLACFNDRLSQ